MKILPILSLSAFLVLSACTSQIPTPEAEEETDPRVTAPFSYELGSVPAELSIANGTFDYTVAQFEDLADECGTEYSDGHFEDLVAQFDGSEKLTYTFAYQEESQESDEYIVTLLPNVPEYKTMDDFKNDFNQCYAGGDAYPTALNSEWLLFVNTCGTGVDDGSGKPQGCSVIQEQVAPTLELR